MLRSRSGGDFRPSSQAKRGVGAVPTPSAEDAFNAAKVMCTMCGGFFKDVAGEVGSEKALALHAKQGEQFGAILAGAWDRMTKES